VLEGAEETDALRQALEVPLDHLAVHLDEAGDDGFLARKIPVEGTGAHAERGAELAHAGLVEAVLGVDGDGRFENSPAAFGQRQPGWRVIGTIHGRECERSFSFIGMQEKSANVRSLFATVLF